MNMNDIITVKRDKKALSKAEIDYFIGGYTKGKIPDYQASALLMAIFLNGISKEETFYLTDAMKNSGDIVDLSGIKGIKVDKHSTGGVGDKTTLIVGPLAASCGVPVAKMSGRGLGFTGGTVDKMEAIQGFRIEIEGEEFLNIVNKTGLAVIGQSGHLAAADKKIYALRDVTATVENIGLITSSIMSKKLAAGADAIVLDVKCGAGAFMEDEKHACELGEWMVDIGKQAGKKTVAFVTEMGQPLGKAVGNANEVIEAIETLKGKGPEDITELSLRLSAYMVFIGGLANDPDVAYDLVKEKLENGEALAKMREFVIAQGGDGKIIDDYSLFPQPKHTVNVYSENDGYVTAINGREIGRASLFSGAGREKKEDAIDLSAGIHMEKKVGEVVKKGEAIATVFGNDIDKLNTAVKTAKVAFTIGKEKPEPLKLIKKIIV